MIPAEALAQHIAIVGTVGAGKTFTAKGVVEALLDAGKRVCIVDPTSAWWGLRLLSDGATPGYKIAILGGEHGDIPLGDGMGAKVGEMIGTRNMPAVLDLSEMLIGDRHKFVTDFAEALFRFNRTPLHLVIDEADEFMPQNPLPETRRMLHHIDRLIRRGRIRGFRVTMITQRPATLHKNALTQANTLIAMRLTSPQDRKAVEEWVKGNADANEAKEVLGSLASLKRGTGWLWCPSLGILKKTVFPAIKTFDSSRSPEEGDNIPEPVALAAVDIDELRASLIETPLVSKPAQKDALVTSVPSPDIEAIRKTAYEEGYGAGFSAGKGSTMGSLRKCADLIANAVASTREDLTMLDAVANQLEAAGDVSVGTMDAESAKVPAIAFTRPETSVFRKQPSQDKHFPQSGKPNGASVSGGAELRILRVLAARHPARFTKAQWATLSKMKRTGGTWGNYVSKLRTAGYIDESDGFVCCSRAGLTAAGPVQAPSSGSVIEDWKSALGSGPSKMLDVLVRAHPHGMDRANLADRVGMTVTGGTFGNYLSALRTNGLVEDKGRRLFASTTLFMDGR